MATLSCQVHTHLTYGTKLSRFVASASVVSYEVGGVTVDVGVKYVWVGKYKLSDLCMGNSIHNTRTRNSIRSFET